MFKFFKRLRQITGDVPLERKHLGQYSYRSHFQDDYTFEGAIEHGNAVRLNTDIYLNCYETNSFKITIENRHNIQEFHLGAMPFDLQGFEVFPLTNKKGVKFLLGVKSNLAYLKMDELMMGTKYFN